MSPPSAPVRVDRGLRLAVGTAAVVAPALHSITDVMEWRQHGFSELQLWLNYLAFLPMPWLLFGIYALHDPGRRGGAGLIGALFYGIAFTYFAHTTLLALGQHVPTYEVLWAQLGPLYTLHGAFMVLGGSLFSWSMRKSPLLPRASVACFAIGLMLNLALALLPGPDILQTIGSALRNVGLIWMGFAVICAGNDPAGENM